MIAYNLKAMKLSSDKYLACLLIRQADAGRYGDLKKITINAGLKGGSSYLTALEAAAALLKGSQHGAQPQLNKR